MKITNRRKFEMDILAYDEFLKFQQSYDDSIVRLTKEIKKWFEDNIDNTFARGQLHPQKIRKIVYGKNRWFKAASIANLNPKFYYMKGYTSEEISLKLKEMKLKNSKGVKKAHIGLTDEEKSRMHDSSSKEFFQKKYGNDWEHHFNHKLDRIYPNRIGYWIDRGYSEQEAIESVKKFQTNSSKKMWTKVKNGEADYITNTRISYYLNKGYSQEEAEAALRNRQATSSKEKLIKKYGEIDGIKKFEERQTKWQKTLNSKSDEEKKVISKKKGTDRNGIPHMGGISKNYLEKYPEKANTLSSLYYLRFFNNEIEFWKIGITTRPLRERFGNTKSKYGLDYEIILENKYTLENCHSLEQKILSSKKDKRIVVDMNDFRSTECFNENIIEDILHVIN